MVHRRPRHQRFEGSRPTTGRTSRRAACATIPNRSLSLSLPGSIAMSKKYDAEEAAIRDLDAKWSRAATAKNMDEVMKFYATDGSVVWPDQPPAKGHKEIRASWEAIFKAAPDMYLDFEPTHIEV